MKSKEDKTDAERKKSRRRAAFLVGRFCLRLLEMRQIFLLFFFAEV